MLRLIFSDRSYCRRCVWVWCADWVRHQSRSFCSSGHMDKNSFFLCRRWVAYFSCGSSSCTTWSSVPAVTVFRPTYLKFLNFALELWGLFGDVLDEAEAEFIFEIGLPELLVVVDIVFEFRVDEFLDGDGCTPAALVGKLCSSSEVSLQAAAMSLALSRPTRSSCYISWRSFYYISLPASSSFPNNIQIKIIKIGL